MVPKLNKSVFVFIVSVSGALLLVALVFWIMLLQGMCGNSEIREMLSSNGQKKVVLFVRHCGATTAYSPQASILGVEEKLGNESGNIFLGDNSEFIDARWLDDNHLTIYHDCQPHDVFKAIAEFEGIHIRYEYQPSNKNANK